MTEISLSEQAERLSKRRARMFPVVAVFYIAQQVSYFSSLEGGRAVDHFKIGAWAVTSAALLIALISGGGLLRGREMRAMLNDETTRAHRSGLLGATRSEGDRSPSSKSGGRPLHLRGEHRRCQ